jgi:hypothetical protein
MFVVFQCVIANFWALAHTSVLAMRSGDLDGRNSLVCAKQRSPNDHVVLQIDSSSSIPFGRKRKMGFACQS